MLIVLGLFGLSAASVALLVHELRTRRRATKITMASISPINRRQGFKTWIFRHRPAQNASREEAAVPAEKHTVNARRELGSVTSGAL